jgi:hypothetical protein
MRRHRRGGGYDERPGRTYGRQRGYDRREGFAASRYDQELGRYGTPFPGAAGYPGARWGWGPVGWAGWGPGLEFWPYADAAGYGFAGGFPEPRRRPEESPTYGAAGDRAVRRWAQRRGYDLPYEVQPRRGRR